MALRWCSSPTVSYHGSGRAWTGENRETRGIGRDRLHRGNRNADRAEVDRGKPVGGAVRIVELRACERVELLHRQPKVWEAEYQTDRNQAANYANSN
jgi:hypothetical protein